MTRTTLFCAAALAAALSACTVNNNAPTDNVTDNSAATTANGGDLTTPPADVSNPPTEAGEGNTATSPAATSIPAAFQGRWGMVPLDCTGDPSAAKGLIAIDTDSIKFYESRAKLAKVTMDAPENFTANFDFSGEGQTWSKSENLKLTNSSKTLTRTDDEGSYNYTRCA